MNNITETKTTEEKTAKCRICGEQVPYNQRSTHQVKVHGKVYGKAKQHAQPSSAIERLRVLEQQVNSLLHDLEAERETLHQRIIEIDNRIEHYKLFSARTSR